MPCCCVFILDTSGSMSTRAHQNFSFFDIAKTYIETFIKGRSKNEGRNMQMGRDGDRYFLLTTNNKYPENIKVLGDKTPIPVFEELKKIASPVGSSPVHHAILDAFRLMHVNRTMTGIDAYGSGRASQNTEQVLIILLTDGSGVATIPNDFKLVFDPPFLGSEMTREAFRWDQKLFSVVFRIPSTPYKPTNSQILNVDIDLPNIEKLCVATGGRSFSIVSPRQINTSIDQMLSTVVLHRIGVRFDCLNTIAGKQTSEDIVKLRGRFKKILEKRPVTNLISRITPQGRPVTCHWQIPENFYPVKNMDALPARLAHPMIHLGTEAIPLNIRNDLPFDKLEIEPCGVTEIVTEMLRSRKDYAVPAYIANSSNGKGNNVPFGCVRLSTNGTGLNLILMPFNYPVLYQLVEDVLKNAQCVVDEQWKARLDSYLQTVPFYFLTTTRQALEKFKVKADVSSSMSNTYASSLLSNLNRLKLKGKDEYDSIALRIKLGESRGADMWIPNVRVERITSRSAISGLGKIEVGENEEEESEPAELVPIISGDFHIPLHPPIVNEPELDTVYRSPWSSDIEDMISKLNKMQANVELIFESSKSSLLDMAKLGVKPRFNNLDEMHNLPLKTMGEYEPYQLARVKYYGTPFKKIEEEKERTHAFGNPYKMKSFGAGIDEVMDSTIVESKRDGKRDGESRMGGGPPKRKRGPLGIDAFDKWRTRRSICGSSALSSVADLSDLDSPSTSMEGGDSDNGVASLGEGKMNGFGNESEENEMMEEKIEELSHMMGTGTQQGQTNKNGNILVNGKPTKNGLVKSTSLPTPTTPIEPKISREEMVLKKISIAAIVRKPANNGAFDDIVALTTGITLENMEHLIQFALREAKRFKHRSLMEKLEKKLNCFRIY